MELERKFKDLEEIAQFLRENGYYVYKQPISFPCVPTYPVYPMYPPQPFYVETKPYFDTGKIVCKNHIENN